MKLHIIIIHGKIIDAYILSNIQDNNGWVYMKICKGVYGLKQAGIIVNLELKKHMENVGSHPVHFTAGIWKHETNDTIFELVVDDFCVKYTSEANAEHFLNAFRQKLHRRNQ